MKKNGIFIPLILSGIVLILVLLTALTHNDFKRTPAETLKLFNEKTYLIGASWIISMPSDKLVFLKIGSGKLPAVSHSIDFKQIELNQLLSGEIKSILSNPEKNKILFSVDIAESVKAWTFLTRMGYSNLYVYDPDSKNSPDLKDSIPQGNEAFHFTFKPEKSETE